MYGHTMLIPSLHKSDVVRLTCQVNDCSISAFFIRCHLVLCLLYRRYFVQCSSDLQIGFRLRFALSKSDAVGLNSLVRFPNRMLFAFGFLIADFNLHNRSVHVCKLDLGL